MRLGYTHTRLYGGWSCGSGSGSNDLCFKDEMIVVCCSGCFRKHFSGFIFRSGAAVADGVVGWGGVEGRGVWCVWFITPVSSQECSVGSGTQPRPVWLFPGCRCRSGPASHGQPFPRTFICPGLKLIHQLGWNYCQSWSGYNQPGLWGRIGGKKDKENRKKGKIVCQRSRVRVKSEWSWIDENGLNFLILSEVPRF